MVENHMREYPAHQAQERLAQLDLTPHSYRRLRQNLSDRLARESVIGQDEVDAVIDLFVEHPEVGAKRAHHTLVDRERAIVSPTFINEARQEIARLAEEEYRQRDEAEKLLEAELRARRRIDTTYRQIEAGHANHIWAMDFVMVPFLSYKLVICEVYDIFTQAYLAIRVGTACDGTLARDTVEAAIANTGGQAAHILRRDNGKAFETVSFQNSLDGGRIIDAPIPPGSPWLNGSLESNNTSLKATIKTKAMQAMPDEAARYSEARLRAEKAVKLLQQACDRARTTLNEELSRSKFAMPPARVMDGRMMETLARHEDFKERKKLERKKRMAELRGDPERTDSGKRFIDKIRKGFAKIKGTIPTNNLHILNEILHGRFQAVEV